MNLGKLCLAVIGLSAAAAVGAQDFQLPTPPEGTAPGGISTIPVELLPPGARALGLAGAFTAVADDATAAEANPAGLTILSAPEVSLHYRDSDNDIPFFDAEVRNTALFNPNLSADPINTYSDSSANISFASFVYPWERFVFSAFYTNNLDIRAEAGSSTFDDMFLDSFVSENAIGGELDGYGLSTAFRVTDMISVGLTVKRSELSLAALDRQVISDFLDLEFIFNQFVPEISPADFAQAIDDEFTISANVNGEDTDTTFNVGVLFNPAGNFSAGLVYKQGGSYDIPGVGRFVERLGCVGSGQAAEICNIGFMGIDLSPFNVDQTQNIVTNVNLPDTLTLGLAWRPGADDTWLISFDINNINYDELPQPRRTTLGFSRPVDDDVEPITDAVTYHLGVEKVFFPSPDWITALTLRGGAFTDEDHDGTSLVDSDDTHITAGIGAVFGENLQIDLGGSFSDRVDNIVLSAIYRF